MNAPAYWAVIPAAGMGIRMSAGTPKQYLGLQGLTILELSLGLFCDHPRIRGTVVVLAENDPHWVTLELGHHEKVSTTVGGRERCDSVRNGLRHLRTLAAPDDWVLVHDAARPCLRLEDIDKLIDTVADHPVGGILAVPAADTMKRENGAGVIRETVERQGLWHALTPQMFRLSVLERALDACIGQGISVTDEAQAVERLDLQPLLVEGHSDNIKITYQVDLALAGFILSQREA